MEIQKSHIVKSLCGRDKDKIFIVSELDGNYALLVNGKLRRLEKPKRKKLKHILFLNENETRVGEKFLKGEKVTNAEVRKSLLAFSNDSTQENSLRG